MVLRGEWTANPPAPVFIDPSTYGTSGTALGSYTVTVTQQAPPAKPDMRKIGARAVRKHADALRRLAA